jgi:hypothetical protein
MFGLWKTAQTIPNPDAEISRPSSNLHLSGAPGVRSAHFERAWPVHPAACAADDVGNRHDVLAILLIISAIA